MVGELVDLSTSEFMMFFSRRLLFVCLETSFEIRDLRKLNCRFGCHYFGWCVCVCALHVLVWLNFDNDVLVTAIVLSWRTSLVWSLGYVPISMEIH